jgi:hypothetical protein
LAILTQARAAVEEMAGVPVACLAGEELVAWLDGVQALKTAVDAVLCRTLADGDPTQIAATDTGHRSVASFAAARSGANPRLLASDAALGAWLRDLPVIAAAFDGGLITRAHVAAIRQQDNSRTRSYLVEAQDYLVESATTLEWRDFQAVLRYWSLAADPDGEEPADHLDRRSCSYTTRPDGTVTGRFTLDPLSGAALRSAMTQLEQRLWRHDQDTGSLRTTTQRRADALIELVMAGAANLDHPLPDPLVHVVMSQRLMEEVFARSAADAPGHQRWAMAFDDIDGRCELLDGTPLHPHAAAAAASIAAFRRLVFSTDGEVLEHGRRTRTFPKPLKQALLVRDRGRCQHRGCDAPVAWLQADHLVPWLRGGPTDLANGQALCSWHNRLKGDRPPGIGPDVDLDAG